MLGNDRTNLYILQANYSLSYMKNRLYLVYAFLILMVSLLGLSTMTEAQVFTDPAFISETVVTLPPFTPVGLTFASDGRIFIWQKSGVVRIVKNGVLLSTPFVNIQSQVNQCEDRGLLGLALDPNFTTNGYVYLFYTYEAGGNSNNCGAKTSRLTRITASTSNPDVALAGSEVIIINNIPSESTSHSVGTLRFAPDGKLFVSHGDGADFASVDALALRSQDLNSYNGKILRINPDGSAPRGNPFDDGTNSIRSKVWAYGLRNPFRFGLHPTTGEPYIGDVGWNTWEEINRGRGANFGWPCYEGDAPQLLYYPAFTQCQQLPPSTVTAPLYLYNRSTGNTVVGGAFYSAFQYPAPYRGNFFFADYSVQRIFRMSFDANDNMTGVQTFAFNIDGPVAIELGPDGALYYVAFNSGEVARIRYTGNSGLPTAMVSATPTSGYSPLQIAFSSAGSFDPDGGPLSYSWDFGDGATSTAPNPQHTYTTNNVVTFTVKLTVTDIEATKDEATIEITVGSVPPVTTILSPVNGTLVSPGQTVVYEGTAIDADDGTLPSSALDWTVLLHHNAHTHFYISNTGEGGSFDVVDHGVGTFGFEILLTATDSSNLTDTTNIFLPMPSVGPAGLVAAYGFNEGTGATTNDDAGNGNLGNIFGASWTTQARFGNGLTFDGVDNFVSVPDAAVLALGATGTMEAWVRLDTLGHWQSVLAKGNFNDDILHNYALEITNTNIIRCILGNGSSFLQLDSTSLAVAGQWMHLACTWDGTTVRLYRDGILNASTAQPLTPVGNTAPLFFGQFGGNADRLDGTLDEVRIYNQALSPAEIQTDMTTPIGGGSTGPDTSAPSTPTNLVATAVSTSQINLSWTASTDNVGVSGYRVERCQGAGCNTFVQIVTSAGPSYNDNTGLVAATSYSYRVRATDAAGNLSPYSSIVSATTQAPDTTAPTAPTNLTATATSTSQINLSWTASTDNIGVTGYQVERCQGAGCSTFVQVATPTTPSYSDTGLTATTSYSYRVRATDAAGNLSPYSASASATTLASPPPGQGLVAAYGLNEDSGTSTADTSGQNNTGTLTNGPTWTTGRYSQAVLFDGTNDHIRVADATSLDLGNTGTMEAWVRVDTLNRWHSVLAKGNANNDAVHNYALEITDANRIRCILGNGASFLALDGSALAVANQFMHLACTWDGTTVQLYLNGVLNASTAQTLTPAGNTAPLFIGQFGGNADRLDGTIDEVRLYSRALSLAELQTDMATPISGVIPSPDTTAPTAPTNLTATATSTSQINLSWTASTDNIGVTGYQVERCQGAGCSTFVQVATPTTPSYSDTGLTATTSYSYRVRATDAAGNLSPYSASASATTLASPPPGQGLVAAYGLNEDSGTSTADTSGQNNTGTLTNGPTWTTGRYSQAVLFDGTNDHIRVADATSLDLGNTGTMEAWVRVDTLNRWHSVLAKGNANNDAVHNYALEITDANRIRCILGNGASFLALDGSALAVANQFMHLACTWDGTTVQLYLNGVLNASTAQTLTPAGNTAPLFIGQFGGNADRLDGTIDEVRLYSRALSLAELQTDMATPLP